MTPRTCRIEQPSKTALPSHRNHWPTAVVGALLLTFAIGCRPETPPTAPPSAPSATKLRLLVVDDKPLGEAIAREWKARTESDIDVQFATITEAEAAKRLPADVVISPSGMLGSLAERSLISPIDDKQLAGDRFNREQVFDLITRTEMRWGRRNAALPLGSPQLLLIYRADLFAKLKLSPPQSWVDYQAAVVRLADRQAIGDAIAADSEWHSVAEPTADGWAGQLLLARAANYATHRDQVASLFEPNSMQPLIATPPYVRALTELVAANKQAAEARPTPADAFQAVRSGRAAMAIGWPRASANNAPTIESASASGDGVEVAVVALPGSTDVYNFALSQWEQRTGDDATAAALTGLEGRQVAICSSANQPQAAMNFVLWLTGDEIVNRVAPASLATAPFRSTQLAAASRWFGDSPLAPMAAESVQASLSRTHTLSVPRLPGRAEYLAALDAAVHAAMDGAEPQAALEHAAAEWKRIAVRLGVETQRQAYLRSLGATDW